MDEVAALTTSATLAEALPKHPNRALRPPLDATLFEQCRLAGLPGRQTVSKYIRTRFGVDPFSGGYGMEEIFNLIYSDAAGDPPPPGCLDAYWALVRMYARAIGSTTNPLTGTSRSGVGALLRHFFNHATEPDLVFVTFNQDLIIEKAIEAARATNRYSHIPWSLRDTYCVSFKDYLVVHGSPRFRSTSGASTIPVLKMHGSLNWTYNVRSGTDARNAIRSPSGPLHCINSANIATTLTTTGPKGRQIDMIPLVVPPIYEKASRYSKAVAPVWSRAAAEISNCDSLVIFGYSLPVADAWARTMLRAAVHANGKLTGVSVIDPSAGSALRIRDVAGVRALHHYVDVPSFVSTDRAQI